MCHFGIIRQVTIDVNTKRFNKSLAFLPSSSAQTSPTYDSKVLKKISFWCTISDSEKKVYTLSSWPKAVRKLGP
ncbi:hypothetical protein BpHYR1_008439 [Brachionus plicatilis]|uniref:Uncharacterized protein n=1 Tax=Brachionus plicatilis TaxID=10195 RepID=A0A3M7SBL6_BRAPC|nr:hypothetical protein BpHYR1_008439 [Brachionus plicatilis]